MADHIPLSGEFCTLMVEGVAVAASRTFTFNMDRETFGNFVARGTTKWARNDVGAISGTFEIDGLIVVVDTTPAASQFDDLFTYMAAGTLVTIVFTLRSNTSGEKTFIYTCEAVITALSTTAPQFGEATYTASLVSTGTVTQTTGTVS